MFIKIYDINANNLTRQNAEVALATVQAGCSARLVTVEMLSKIAVTAERAFDQFDIPEKARKGARYEFSEGGVRGVPASYGRYPRYATYVCLERNTRGWGLIEVRRIPKFPGNAGSDNLILTQEQADIAQERFLKKFRTYRAEAKPVREEINHPIAPRGTNLAGESSRIASEVTAAA